MHRASASGILRRLCRTTSGFITYLFGVDHRITYRWFKLEGSFFNGREPDENVTTSSSSLDFALGKMSFAPNSNWSMQVSYGFLRDPEPLEPATCDAHGVYRYNRPLKRVLATSLLGAESRKSQRGDLQSNGYLQSRPKLLDKNYLYTLLSLSTKCAASRRDRDLLHH